MAGSGWRHEEREVEKLHLIRNRGSTGFIVLIYCQYGFWDMLSMYPICNDM